MVAVLLAVALSQSAPIHLTFTVDGVQREANLYRASDTTHPVPTVFVWHGYTGGMRQAAIAYRVHEAWPEANVIYPQGLQQSYLGATGPGWQIRPGMQGDRDVKLYDAILAKVKSDYKADPKRIYSCGMSNGAIFTYVLLCTRANTLAAAAPVAGIAPRTFKGAPATPILITHGTKDTRLPFAGAERSRDVAIGNNGAGNVQKEWKPGYTEYTPAQNGNQVIWHTHDGGHEWPKGTTEAIVEFFKSHARAD